MERLLRVASPLGLYAEEFDVDTGRHLGNFPQAFSHLALIEAAARIIVRRDAGGAVTDGRLRRDHHRHRRRRRHARASPRPLGQADPPARARRLAAAGARRTGRADDVFVDNRYVSPDTWYDEKGKAFQPQVHYFVGGATKLYGAALYRLREEDFGELRHHDGISPAWPISYDELEPYYTQAEQLYEVHGARGEDPTEPPSSAPYPFPAVSHEPRIQQLSDDLAAAGYHPFHAPCGIMLDETNMPYSRVHPLPDCDGFPCLVHAKSDAEVLGVRPALEHPNVTLLTNAKAVRLETNDAGTAVTAVVVERDGDTERVAADIVVLACGAANTAKLLLESANEKHPNGLANGSDQVGRNYMFHDSARCWRSPRGEPDVFQKTLGLNDFYFGSDDFEYPLGNIQMVGKSVAEMFRGEKPGETKLAPEWTLERIARHAIDFWLSTEDLPRPDNRVSVDARRQADAELHARRTPRRRSGCTASSTRCSASST